MTFTPTQRRFLFWVTLITLLVLFTYNVRSILLPFVVGILIAYFLDPAVDALERKQWSRGIATASIILAFFIIMGALGALLIPEAINQLARLLETLPTYVRDLDQMYRGVVNQVVAAVDAVDNEYSDAVQSAAGNISTIAVDLVTDFLAGVLNSGSTLLNLVSLLLITPLVAFYLLRDWDNITHRLETLLPRRNAKHIMLQLAEMDATMAGFIRGQLTVCVILAIFYGGGLSLVGLNFGLVIGLLTGALVIVPYLGFAFGFVLGLGVAFFQYTSLMDYVPMLVVFGVGQMLEGYFLTPKLVGDRVGLHPLWIIFGMLAGGALFGFVGILIAVPATAMIGVLIRFAVQDYLNSEYYKA